MLLSSLIIVWFASMSSSKNSREFIWIVMKSEIRVIGGPAGLENNISSTATLYVDWGRSSYTFVLPFLGWLTKSEATTAAANSEDAIDSKYNVIAWVLLTIWLTMRQKSRCRHSKQAVRWWLRFHKPSSYQSKNNTILRPRWSGPGNLRYAL